MLDHLRLRIPVFSTWAKSYGDTSYFTENLLDYEIRRTEPMLQVRGVMQMKGKCLAYNAYGDVMTLSQADCKDYVGTGRVFRAEPSQNMTVRGEPYTPSEPREQPPQ